MSDHFTPNGALGAQQAEIIEILERQGSVTGYELAQLGIIAYNARINELREKGYPITCIMEDHTNKRGKKVKRGRFVLIRPT